MHFHASSITNADTSSAISGGQDSGNVSRIVITRNLFYDCDHGLLCKEGNECPSQKTLRLLDSAVRMGFIRTGIASACFVDGIDGQ